MTRVRLMFACVVLTVTAASTGPHAWAARGAGTVFSGTVGGTDQGFLSGASVVIDGPVHRDTRTDADGRFTIADVSPGRYRLQVSAQGYLPLDRPLDVGAASVSVDIVLLRIPRVP